MLALSSLRTVDEQDQILDEVKFILDLIAKNDLMLSSGHLHISEIWPLFEEVTTSDVRRLLVNRQSYIVDATLENITQLVAVGAYTEHSMCMFTEGSKYKFYEADELDAMIKAAGIDRTILESDLGQVGNPTPVEGFRSVIGLCLELGYEPTAVRKMVSSNACELTGLQI